MKEPGVYVLYGENDECLYVGSSVNMKARCRFHPYGALAKRIEYNPCSLRELGPLEQKTIDRLKPKLNRNKKVTRHDGGVVFVPRLTGISLTLGDRRLVNKLKRQFEPEHGKQTATGVIRIALRQAVLAGSRPLTAQMAQSLGYHPEPIRYVKKLGEFDGTTAR